MLIPTEFLKNGWATIGKWTPWLLIIFGVLVLGCIQPTVCPNPNVTVNVTNVSLNITNCDLTPFYEAVNNSNCLTMYNGTYYLQCSPNNTICTYVYQVNQTVILNQTCNQTNQTNQSVNLTMYPFSCADWSQTYPIWDMTRYRCQWDIRQKYNLGKSFSAIECCATHWSGYWMECCQCANQMGVYGIGYYGGG